MECKIAECKKVVKTTKSMLCEKHYFRLRRTGSTGKAIPKAFVTNRIHKTKNYGELIIVEYINRANVKIKFINTGYIAIVNGGSIINGHVKDPTFPTVFGVGFIGSGKYKSSINKSKTAAYSRWVDMLRRCYCEKSRKNNKSYADVYVCDDWHNFQNFAAWFYDNHIDGFDLDKDILSGKEKVYSPETCCFVSREVNSLYSKNCLGKKYKIKKDDISVKFSNIGKAAKRLNLDSGNLCRLVNGKLNSHKGWVNEL